MYPRPDHGQLYLHRCENNLYDPFVEMYENTVKIFPTRQYTPIDPTKSLYGL